MLGSRASLRISERSSSVSLKAANWSSCLHTLLASITVLKMGKPCLAFMAASYVWVYTPAQHPMSIAAHDFSIQLTANPEHDGTLEKRFDT